MKLKDILSTSEAYAILDSSEAAGCTWTSGGCFILARALNLLYDLPIYAIVESDGNIPHHFVVLRDGRYLDYDGEVVDILRAFRRRENIRARRLEIREYNPSMDGWIVENNIPMDLNASTRLSEFIQEETTKTK